MNRISTFSCLCAVKRGGLKAKGLKKGGQMAKGEKGKRLKANVVAKTKGYPNKSISVELLVLYFDLQSFIYSIPKHNLSMSLYILQPLFHQITNISPRNESGWHGHKITNRQMGKGR